MVEKKKQAARKVARNGVRAVRDHAYFIYDPIDHTFVTPMGADVTRALTSELHRRLVGSNSAKDPPPEVARATDPVHHPAHYTQGAVECVEAICAQLTPDEFIGFLRGSIAKYQWRLRLKGDPLEQLAKSRWYLDRLERELVGLTNAEKENAS